MTVRGTKPVNLGVMQDDGSTTPGTTLKIIVNKDSPYFDVNTPTPNSYPNAFEIDTQIDFTAAEARQSEFLSIYNV